MGSHLLSKSSFIRGVQCEKHLYLYNIFIRGVDGGHVQGAVAVKVRRAEAPGTATGDVLPCPSEHAVAIVLEDEEGVPVRTCDAQIQVPVAVEIGCFDRGIIRGASVVNTYSTGSANVPSPAPANTATALLLNTPTSMLSRTARSTCPSPFRSPPATMSYAPS